MSDSYLLKHWMEQLTDVLVPHIQDGLKSLYIDARRINKNNPLKMFQMVLETIPNISQSKLETDYRVLLRKRGGKRDWLKKILKVIFAAHAKMDLVARGGDKKLKIKEKDLQIPDDITFLHKCYIEAARVIWVSPFLFSDKYDSIVQQKNHALAAEKINRAIEKTVRKLIPFEQLHYRYLEETIYSSRDRRRGRDRKDKGGKRDRERERVRDASESSENLESLLDNDSKKIFEFSARASKESTNLKDSILSEKRSESLDDRRIKISESERFLDRDRVGYSERYRDSQKYENDRPKDDDDTKLLSGGGSGSQDDSEQSVKDSENNKKKNMEESKKDDEQDSKKSDKVKSKKDDESNKDNEDDESKKDDEDVSSKKDDEDVSSKKDNREESGSKKEGTLMKIKFLDSSVDDLSILSVPDFELKNEYKIVDFIEQSDDLTAPAKFNLENENKDILLKKLNKWKYDISRWNKIIRKSDEIDYQKKKNVNKDKDGEDSESSIDITLEEDGLSNTTENKSIKPVKAKIKKVGDSESESDYDSDADSASKMKKFKDKREEILFNPIKLEKKNNRKSGGEYNDDYSTDHESEDNIMYANEFSDFITALSLEEESDNSFIFRQKLDKISHKNNITNESYLERDSEEYNSLSSNLKKSEIKHKTKKLKIFNDKADFDSGDKEYYDSANYEDYSINDEDFVNNSDNVHESDNDLDDDQESDDDLDNDQESDNDLDNDEESDNDLDNDEESDNDSDNDEEELNNDDEESDDDEVSDDEDSDLDEESNGDDEEGSDSVDISIDSENSESGWQDDEVETARYSEESTILRSNLPSSEIEKLGRIRSKKTKGNVSQGGSLSNDRTDGEGGGTATSMLISQRLKELGLGGNKMTLHF